MTDTAQAARDLVDHADLILLDFDGPVCHIFANGMNRRIADELRLVAREHGMHIDDELAQDFDPLNVLREADRQDGSLTKELDLLMTELEIDAATVAPPAIGGADALRQWGEHGKRVVVVTNNSAASIEKYLSHHGLTSLVGGIYGRPPGETSLMKPHPFILLEALSAHSVEPANAVMIGDSVSDVAASSNAGGVPAIGLAHTDLRADELNEAGAVVVVRSMSVFGE